MLSISILSKLLSLDETIFEENISDIVTEKGYCIFLKVKRKGSFCPDCGNTDSKIKDWQKRILKHSLLYGKDTYIYVKIPRYICKECGKTFEQPCSLFPKYSKISMKTVVDVLKELMEWTSTFESVGKHLRLSNTAVQNIFDKYVNPRRKRLPEILSLDEAYENGEFNEPYMVVLFDFMNGKIVDVIEDRSKYNLSKYFNRVERTERLNVKYVLIDMWEPYVDVASTFFPNASILVDSFHVMQNIYRALQKVRCRIMKRFEDDAKSEQYYLLKKYNYLLTTNPQIGAEKEYNYKFKAYFNEYQLQQKLLEIDPELKIIYNFWANYHHFNKSLNNQNLSETFDMIVMDPTIITVPEFIPVIQMLQTWKEFILRSFTVINERRLSNGPIEGLNSQLKKLMKVANGWANFERFRAKLMFCYNKEFSLTPVKNKIRKLKTKKRGKYQKNRQNQLDSDGN